jgi:hypothetical protein
MRASLAGLPSDFPLMAGTIAVCLVLLAIPLAISWLSVRRGRRGLPSFIVFLVLVGLVPVWGSIVFVELMRMSIDLPGFDRVLAYYALGAADISPWPSLIAAAAFCIVRFALPLTTSHSLAAAAGTFAAAVLIATPLLLLAASHTNYRAANLGFAEGQSAALAVQSDEALRSRLAREPDEPLAHALLSQRDEGHGPFARQYLVRFHVIRTRQSADVVVDVLRDEGGTRFEIACFPESGENWLKAERCQPD